MSKPPSKFQLIRDFLKAQPGTEPEQYARSTAEIAIGIGLEGDVRVGWWVGAMMHDKQLDRVGAGRSSRYYVVREVATRERMSDDEARRRKNEREKRRHKLRGGKSVEEYRAELERLRQERLAATVARKEERRLSKLLRPKQPRKKAPKPAPKPARRVTLDVAQVAGFTKPLTPPAPVRRAMTVEEFLAEGGKVDVLTPCTWSTPLRSHG